MIGAQISVFLPPCITTGYWGHFLNVLWSFYLQLTFLSCINNNLQLHYYIGTPRQAVNTGMRGCKNKNQQQFAADSCFHLHFHSLSIAGLWRCPTDWQGRWQARVRVCWTGSSQVITKGSFRGVNSDWREQWASWDELWRDIYPVHWCALYVLHVRYE